MYKRISHYENAILVLHEIYGINAHIQRICDIYHQAGFDIYCPNLINRSSPFTYEQHQDAYNYFNEVCGFSTSEITELTARLRASYKKVIIVGFSVGGTLAWLSSSKAICDGVVSFYGSRIRDYTDHVPDCPVLVIQARYEEAYNPVLLEHKLSKYPMVSFHLFDCRHGFCDAFSKAFDQTASDEALALSHSFISDVVGISA
ncbi:TPA: dienelactone hydrolase family protein [Salmonella enterica]